MSKTLAILSGAGLVLCGCFLGLAYLIGGDDVFHDPRSLQGVKPLIDMATRKEWRWQGGDTLALNAPINVRYEAQGAPRVSVTGPAELLEHVRVGEGRIVSDTTARRGGKKLEAVVSGVPIRKFVVNGRENLDLGHIDQPSLDVHLNGVGTVTGEGAVERLNLTIAGPGKAELSGLSVTAEARVSILGNGEAALAPKGHLRLFIAGNGKLSLASKPKTVSQTIVGNGEMENIPPPPAPPLPPAGISPLPVPVPVPMPIPIPNDVQIRSDGRNVFVKGSQSIDLGRIDQESLNITIAASGSATAEGKVDTLNVQVLGSGSAHLGKLAARNVKVSILGSGTATVAPSEELKASIMGSGDVRLTTQPAEIERTIMGSGKIVDAR
jgi:hypothetical protein